MLLLVSIYLVYVATRAKQSQHFLIGRYLTTAIFAVCFYWIGYPIYLEIRGEVAGDDYFTFGVILLFPVLAFRNAITARRIKLFGTAGQSKSETRKIK